MKKYNGCRVITITLFLFCVNTSAYADYCVGAYRPHPSGVSNIFKGKCFGSWKSRDAHGKELYDKEGMTFFIRCQGKKDKYDTDGGKIGNMCLDKGYQWQKGAQTWFR